MPPRCRDKKVGVYGLVQQRVDRIRTRTVLQQTSAQLQTNARESVG